MNECFKSSLSQNGIKELEEFKYKTSVFGKLFETQFKSPEIFWKLAKPFYSELSSLAEKLRNLQRNMKDYFLNEHRFVVKREIG